MKSILFSTLLFLWAVNGMAQQRYTFHSQNYIGLLAGEKNTALQFETINGIQSKSWFAGIGTGLDQYHVSSIPLFLQVSRYFFKEQRFFINANAGINFAWRNNSFDNGRNQLKHPPADFCEAGLGYLLATTKKNQGILVNIGYSFKRFREKIDASWRSGSVNTETVYDVYDYHFSRLVFKLGFQL